MRWASVLMLTLVVSGCGDSAPRVFATVERDRLTLSAPVGELVAAVNVVEGQQVQAGELLLTLDDTSARARVGQRQAAVAQAQARLAELVNGPRQEDLARARASLAGAEASVQEAQLTFSRAKRLVATKVLTEADMDEARAARDIAVARQAEARQSLMALENGTRSEQLEQARAAVALAEAELAVELKALADLRLTVAEAAVVDNLPWRVGDRVAAGTQLIALLATDRPYVRAYLPATWLDRVRPGSKVRIFVDGRTQPLDGVVRNIRSQPAYTPFYALNERDRARLMYLTDIDLGAGGEALATGLGLEVELPQ